MNDQLARELSSIGQVRSKKHPGIESLILETANRTGMAWTWVDMTDDDIAFWLDWVNTVWDPMPEEGKCHYDALWALEAL
jgi:hypothetical protein